MNERNSVECSSNELTYYQWNTDVILKRAKKYYENDKERLREQARDNYRTLSEEEKNKKKRIWKKTDIRICLKKKKSNTKD